MKNVFLTAIAVATLSLTGISCSSDDNNNSSESVIQPSELSTDCKTFVETYFSEHNILKIERDTNSIDEYYEISLSGGIKIELNQSCQWTEVDGDNIAIPTGFINTNIVNYVTTNYPTTAIESIEKKSYGFDVDLVNDTELRFDANGEFLGLGN